MISEALSSGGWISPLVPVGVGVTTRSLESRKEFMIESILNQESIERAQKNRNSECWRVDEAPSSSGSSNRIIGKQVAVYWSDDDVYYRGKVHRVRDDGRMHIKYDDGDKGWIDPFSDKYKWVNSTDPLPLREFSPDLETVQIGCRISVWWPSEQQYYNAVCAENQGWPRAQAL